MSTTARIAYLRTAEKPDALGEKVVFTGVLEDATSKVSFVSHKIALPADPRFGIQYLFCLCPRISRQIFIISNNRVYKTRTKEY